MYSQLWEERTTQIITVINRILLPLKNFEEGI